MEVMSLFAPEAAALNALRAPEAVSAPVPPPIDWKRKAGRERQRSVGKRYRVGESRCRAESLCSADCLRGSKRCKGTGSGNGLNARSNTAASVAKAVIKNVVGFVVKQFAVVRCHSGNASATAGRTSFDADCVCHCLKLLERTAVNLSGVGEFLQASRVFN